MSVEMIRCFIWDEMENKHNQFGVPPVLFGNSISKTNEDGLLSASFPDYFKLFLKNSTIFPNGIFSRLSYKST